MTRYIVQRKDGAFLTPRRWTGEAYRCRSTWSNDLGDSRIFNTVSSAKNSARSSSGEWRVREVRISLVPEVRVHD